MPISSADPAFLLIYGLDESLATAVRVNSGSLGSDYDLSQYQSTGTDGVLSIADGNGGKAAWFDVQYPSPYTAMTVAYRALRSSAKVASGHAAAPTLPTASAANDFALGVRFKWVGGETDGAGATEQQNLFGLADSVTGTFGWTLGILPNVSTTPATGAKLVLRLGDNGTITVGGASWVETNSPPTQHILPDVWYRVVVRVYYSAAGFLVKVYLFNESNNTTYTFTYNSAVFTAGYAAAWTASTTARVYIGMDNGFSANPMSLYGYIDNAWLYDAPMSDGDAGTILDGGLTIPWSEPSYSQLDHDVRVAVAKEGASFPNPRALPTGGLKARHPVNVRARRLRVRYSAFRAGRPWALRLCQMVFDSSGPRSGRQDVPQGFVKFEQGFVRRPGSQPAESLADGRNVSLRGNTARSRRGFRIRRDVASVDAANSFISYRDLSDNLFRLYKVGNDLYSELGVSASSIDTGWGSTHIPSYGLLNGRIVILTPSRQKTHRSSFSAVESFGIAAPAAPTTALAAGTLTGTYYYLYTEYDPNTGDESAPGVAASTVSPSGQGVTLTLAAVSSDTRFSQRRIYRSTSGGSATTATLIATITSATSYTDSGAADGVTTIAQVGGSYITGTPPDTFSAVTIHRERAFYYGGATYSNRVYWTEAGTLMRFYASAYIEAEGPVRCVIAQGQRLIVFTDYGVEIVESDWVRNSSDGSYNIQRTVVSRTVGCFGHKAAINAHGRVFWIDSRGAWTLNGDEPRPISEQISGLFPFINTNLKRRVIAAYNHIQRQIWFCVAMGGSEFQDDTSRVQTILVYKMDDGTWNPPYQLEASYADQFDDDLNGLQFGIMDGIGCFKQMETYEGDGIEGDETHTFEGTISTLTSRVLTPLVAPTGWTTNLLRGMSVVLIDSVTGEEFYTLVSSNTTTTLTLLEDPGAGFGSPDTFYVGGIRSFIEPAEQDFGTQNDKVCRFLNSEFDDISTTRIV